MRTEKLLFRWIGSDIEKWTAKKRVNLTHEQRQKYLKYLDNALDPHKGLYAKVSSGEYLGKKVTPGKANRKPQWEFKSELPCLCFTELDLGDSADHISQFGRLGFGFTKQFIVSQGGGPVQYCLGTEDCKRVADLARIRKCLLRNGKPKADQETWQAFLRMAHFYKRLREVVEKRKAPTKPGTGKQAEAAKKFRPAPSHEEHLAKNARYARQQKMPHLEEYEWRIVFADNHPQWHKIKGGSTPETAWFHIEPGVDLQMVIVPDNRCHQMVHELPCITDRLFKIPKKPVQVVSLEILAQNY